MKKFGLLLLFCFVTFLLFGQKNNNLNNQNQLDSLMQLIRASYDVPGFTVGIIKNGDIYYSNALGVQGKKDQAPLTEKSLFHMASVSKPFVATAVMQLVEQGKVDLDKPITDYLPYFKMKDKRYKKITVKQVLNHTSGIPDVDDYEWDKPQYDDGAAERFVRGFASLKLDFKPGKEHSYSNAAYDMMGDLIAKVSGMTFEEYMTQKILKPIGMKNSTFLKPDVPEQIATKPHGIGKDLQMEELDIYPYNRRHAPSSTLHSNVEDMLLWAQVYLNKGEVNGKKIFSSSSYTNLTTVTENAYNTTDICLGWFTQKSSVTGESIFYHSGGDDGYRTFFCFIPARKAAVFVMGNNNSFRSFGTAAHLIRTEIFETPGIWKRPMHLVLKDKILTEGIAACRSFYEDAKQNHEDEYTFNGGDLDDLGYWLLDGGHHQEALDIFLFNVDLEPEYPGWPDSVADAYVAMGNKEKAIEWYKKALAINPKQDFSIKKLKELQEE
ncbi:MAG: serine hydrolase [Bacteroidota bacterium]